MADRNRGEEPSLFDLPLHPGARDDAETPSRPGRGGDEHRSGERGPGPEWDAEPETEGWSEARRDSTLAEPGAGVEVAEHELDTASDADFETGYDDDLHKCR